MNRESSILVVGRSGRIARALIEEAERRSIALRAIGRPQLDIEDPQSISRVLAARSPSVIINAAGCVEVDDAERNPDRAFALNRDGAMRLAEFAAGARTPFLHLSTDYVFDGCKPTPYVEDDPAAPINIYGRSKLAGEEAVLSANPAAIVVRTAWVFTPFGQNFLTTMLRLAETQETVRVVSDQYGTPTPGTELGHALLDIAEQLPTYRGQLGGIYHLAGSGATSWFGLAEAIFAAWARRGHRIPRLQAITRAEWSGPAARPQNSSLACGKAERVFGIKLPPWQASLEPCLDRIIEQRTSAGDAPKM